MPDLHSHKGPSFLSYFPLLALVLVGYNISIFTGHAFNAPNSDTLLQV
ncbi:MAG: hypothetical protein JWO89_3818, partial [Verrucomicrobiaceae bacterium]|nr:hypothetical protein [Verrucomicrobiaceae bacterium]